MNYDEMFESLKPLDAERTAQLTEKCMTNSWLRRGNYPLDDYAFSFVKTDNIDVLERYFEHGNWSIRNGIVYDDLAFVNQSNGGDEWWTLKYDSEKNCYVNFESMNFTPSIKSGEFKGLISDMQTASVSECVNLEYSSEMKMSQSL
jgi:hypothetical protein